MTPLAPNKRTSTKCLAVAVILVIHVAGRIGAYCSPIPADDSYIYASFGCRMAHGDVLYRDMSDIKPPGLFMLYALVYLVAPACRVALVPVESAFLLAGYYAIYRLCLDLFGRGPALLAAVFAAVAINFFSVTGYAIASFAVAECYMVLPAAAAIFFYRRAARAGQSRCLFAAGVCMGIGTCLKQTALPVTAAIVIHWLITSFVKPRRDARISIGGTVILFLGGCAGWLPAIVMMLHQGTLTTAYTLLTADAGAMFGRSTAWPQQWQDIAPFTVPAAWLTWTALMCQNPKRQRGANASPLNPSPSHDPHSFTRADFALLSLWSAAELYLVLNLPLRSSHYYISACVPFLILAAAPFAMLRRSIRHWPSPARTAAWSFAVIASAVFLRPSIDEIIPRAITAHRNYDWSAEQQRFDDALHWGKIHFGRGKPFLAPPPRANLGFPSQPSGFPFSPVACDRERARFRVKES